MNDVPFNSPRIRVVRHDTAALSPERLGHHVFRAATNISHFSHNAHARQQCVYRVLRSAVPIQTSPLTVPDTLGGKSKVTANTRLPPFFGLAPLERPLESNGPHTQLVLVGNGELGELRLMLAEKSHPPACSCGNSCASLVVKLLLASTAYGFIAHPGEASKQSRMASGLQLKRTGN